MTKRENPRRRENIEKKKNRREMSRTAKHLKAIFSDLSNIPKRPTVLSRLWAVPERTLSEEAAL